MDLSFVTEYRGYCKLEQRLSTELSVLLQVFSLHSDVLVLFCPICPAVESGGLACKPRKSEQNCQKSE